MRDTCLPPESGIDGCDGENTGISRTGSPTVYSLPFISPPSSHSLNLELCINICILRIPGTVGQDEASLRRARSQVQLLNTNSVLFYRRPNYLDKASNPTNVDECQRYVERAKSKL
jgi:hypothetical protein